MRPVAIALILAAGAATAATAATVARRGPAAPAELQEPVRPGPDSARVASLLASVERIDPVACEMLSDQVGNFWWSDGGVGVGQFADVRTAARAAKDSLAAPVRDPRAVTLLVARLEHDDPCVRLVAAKLLGNSTASDAAITRALDAGAARVREAALRAAGERDRPALRARVERMLGDEPAVAAMAAWALGEFETRASVPALVRALAHEDARVRAAAAWALGAIEDPASATDVERLLARERDRRVRLAAVRALGSIESRGSATVLLRLLEEDDVALAVEAAEALQSLDLDGEAPDALIRAAESGHAALRYAALHALVDLEDARLVPLFVRFISDPDPAVRMSVIHALGHLEAVEAIPALRRALDDRDPEVRRAAIEALAEIDDR